MISAPLLAIAVLGSAVGLGHSQSNQNSKSTLSGPSAAGLSAAPDILRFALGMTGRDAEARIRAFYSQQERQVLLKRSKLDPREPEFLAVAAPSTYGLRMDEDNLVLAFSGSASENRLFYITRDAGLWLSACALLAWQRSPLRTAEVRCLPSTSG
jgi:hypothetical protein